MVEGWLSVREGFPAGHVVPATLPEHEPAALASSLPPTHPPTCFCSSAAASSVCCTADLSDVIRAVFSATVSRSSATVAFRAPAAAFTRLRGKGKQKMGLDQQEAAYACNLCASSSAALVPPTTSHPAKHSHPSTHMQPARVRL